MKLPLISILALLAACDIHSCEGCGYASADNELTGQVKKVVKKTPLIGCADYSEVDISLGVMRGGVGSLSKEDLILTVEDDSQVALLKEAAETGAIVRVTYSELRVPVCGDKHHVKSVMLLPNGSAS